MATTTYAHSAGTRQAYPVLLLFAMSSVEVSPYFVTLRRVSDRVLGDRRYASHTRCRRNVYLENHQTIPAIKLSALLASVENKITDLLLRHAVQLWLRCSIQCNATWTNLKCRPHKRTELMYRRNYSSRLAPWVCSNGLRLFGSCRMCFV